MTLDCEVVETRSGAKAIRDRTTGQLMHPVVGPAIESQRLYIGPSRIEERLRDASATPLVLLDVGLGAASNAIAAWRVSEALSRESRPLEIVSFDRSLAALALALAPEHASAFGFEDDAGVAARAILESGHHRTERTSWRFVAGDLATTLDGEPSAIADVVFWDPFSPRASPELWTMRAFASLFRLCRDRASVHTYSGATATRSALSLAGFAVGEGVELDDGRRTTCAAMRPEDLDRPLDRRWLERLARSSAPFPLDAPVDALAQIASRPQFR
jgi:queuine tRNA-ribosyltransferase